MSSSFASVGLQNTVMSMSVCLCVCVCVSDYLFVRSYNLKTAWRVAKGHHFLCTLPAAVVQSSSDGVVIRYVLPVLWMTSCFIQGDQWTDVVQFDRCQHQWTYLLVRCGLLQPTGSASRFAGLAGHGPGRTLATGLSCCRGRQCTFCRVLRASSELRTGSEECYLCLRCF